MEEKKEAKNKLTLKERWKDKRERAKLELILYGIFFLTIILFARITTAGNTKTKEETPSTFINTITDNYQYNIDITINNNKYKYYGKKLGHNMSITRSAEEKEDYFYQMNDKYYILDNNGNYILTTTNEIFPYIDYRYLDINNIKEYIKLGTKDNNTYNIKVSDIVLNSTSTAKVTITIDDNNKSIIIDYTNLFKLDNSSLTKELVEIKYSNINSINSLEE